MNTYMIFERMASYTDSRVRWHEIAAPIKATSRPDALRKFMANEAFMLKDNCVIDRVTNCVMMGDPLGGPSHLIMAERVMKIDFDHYDIIGSLVEVAR